MREYNTIQNNISKWASRTKKNGCRRRRAPCAPGNVFLAVSFFLFRSLEKREEFNGHNYLHRYRHTHARANKTKFYVGCSSRYTTFDPRPPGARSVRLCRGRWWSSPSLSADLITTTTSTTQQSSAGTTPRKRPPMKSRRTTSIWLDRYTDAHSAAYH